MHISKHFLYIAGSVFVLVLILLGIFAFRLKAIPSPSTTPAATTADAPAPGPSASTNGAQEPNLDMTVSNDPELSPSSVDVNSIGTRVFGVRVSSKKPTVLDQVIFTTDKDTQYEIFNPELWDENGFIAEAQKVTPMTVNGMTSYYFFLGDKGVPLDVGSSKNLFLVADISPDATTTLRFKASAFASGSTERLAGLGPWGNEIGLTLTVPLRQHPVILPAKKIVESNAPASLSWRLPTTTVSATISFYCSDGVRVYFPLAGSLKNACGVKTDLPLGSRGIDGIIFSNDTDGVVHVFPEIRVSTSDYFGGSAQSDVFVEPAAR